MPQIYTDYDPVSHTLRQFTERATEFYDWADDDGFIAFVAGATER